MPRLGILSRGAEFHAKFNVTPVIMQDYFDPGVVKPQGGVEYYPWINREQAIAECDHIYIIGFFCENLELKQQYCQFLDKPNGKVIIHWIGTDVLNCAAFKESGEKELFEKLKQPNVVHLAENQEMRKEVLDLGVPRVTLCPVASRIQPEVLPLPTKMNGELHPLFSVYMPPQRHDFFNKDLIMQVAAKTPELNYIFYAYSDGQKSTPLTENVMGWGKIPDGVYQTLIKQSTGHLRLVEHDGISLTMVEFCMAGRYFITNQERPHTIKCGLNVDEVVARVREVALKKTPNKVAARYYAENFGADRHRATISKILAKEEQVVR